MNKSRRIGALVAATVASVGMGTMVAPTVAEASPRGWGPQPVSNFVQRVRAHTDTWVSIRWQTDRRICDASVWVNGRRVDVDYPRNARSTSFSRGDTLRPGRSDYTAFRVNADFDRSGVALLRATIAYDNCGRHARTIRKSFGIALPVVAIRGNGHGHGDNDWDRDNDGRGNGHGDNDRDRDRDNDGRGNDNGRGNYNGRGNNNGDDKRVVSATPTPTVSASAAPYGAK